MDLGCSIYKWNAGGGRKGRDISKGWEVFKYLFSKMHAMHRVIVRKKKTMNFKCSFGAPFYLLSEYLFDPTMLWYLFAIYELFFNSRRTTVDVAVWNFIYERSTVSAIDLKLSRACYWMYMHFYIFIPPIPSDSDSLFDIQLFSIK